MFKKVLLLGSGALKIGEAGEFDYSGSQALKALKEEKITTILINPNIATIQTSQGFADKIYFLPVTPYFVEEVIKKEKPDGIMLSFGGQTALNCGLALEKSGVFKKYGVKVLGTPVKSIESTEDRQLFAKTLSGIGIKIPRGSFASKVEQALKIAKKLTFPLFIRSDFALGGLGSAVVADTQELKVVVANALRHSPQVAVEEFLKHWKEVEYEVVRDKLGNKITVCNMENMDPMGVHTGESVVVAPSQTLNNYEYHLLRKISLQVIEHLGIIGECNIQFALDPDSHDWRVIEVNARLSRSSALASKATGYPLAYIAAKLGLGYTLGQLKNGVTLSTCAFFEPSLDYIVIKIPRWDLQKFVGAYNHIGSEMKSVGEVMAIGRSFPEALQKAVRMLEIGQDGLLTNQQTQLSLKQLLSPRSDRLFTISQKLMEGVSVEKIHKYSGIDPWFLYQIKEVVEFEKSLNNRHSRMTLAVVIQAKKLGFSDKLLAKAFKTTEEKIRNFRKKHGILPKVKHIDTLAGEFPAKTNYLYLTYNAEESEDGNWKSSTSSSLSDLGVEDLRAQTEGMEGGKKNKAIVLGSGPYRIGSSVEFDWCCVQAAQTFKEKGLEVSLINCNPETVSTDYDIADKLYFEELSFERVSDIYDIEKDGALVLGFGGQTPNNLSLSLYKSGLNILGTNPQNIDRAEDRHKFSQLLDSLNIAQPAWRSLEDTKEAIHFAKKIGYPVLVRPSYVLSGTAMNVAYTSYEIKKYLRQATKISPEYPVVISKFIDGAKEIEIDGVAEAGKLLIYAISEHIENAGIHSGDATIVLPPQRLFLETVRKIKNATKRIISKLNINGPFNIQFLAKNNQIMVIELNLRASRSFPFVSKVTGYNFVKIATQVILGEESHGDFKTLDLDYVAVKAPQFSFSRIKGADPKLRVEMASTGEVACFGNDQFEAYLKSLISTGFRLPKNCVFLSIGGDKNKLDFLEAANYLTSLGFKIYATDNTCLFLQTNSLRCSRVYKISEGRHPSVLDLLEKGEIDLAINISEPGNKLAGSDGFIIRRSCIDLGVPLITDLQAAQLLVSALASKKLSDLEIKSWDEYIKT